MKDWGAESWAVFTVGAVVLFFGTGGYWSATWLSKWAIIVAFAALGLSLWTARRTSLWHLPLLLYTFGSLISLGVWPQNPYDNQIEGITLIALEKNALFGFTEFSSLLVLFALVSKRMSHGARGLFALIWTAGTFTFLFSPLAGNNTPSNNGRWFGNPSMGASLLACMVPFVCSLAIGKKLKSIILIPTVWILTLAMIYRTRASVPWGVLGVVTAAGILSFGFKLNHKKAWQLFLPVVGIGLIMCTLGKSLLGHEFWDQNGRFRIWSMAYDWYKVHSYPSIGMGFSSSQILLPLEQMITKHYYGDYFLWLHNDWLQLLIEGGRIGFACVLLSTARLVVITRKQPALFASLMGFVTMGLFNYPLRMPIHAFCLALLCGLAEAYATRHVEISAQTRSRVA